MIRAGQTSNCIACLAPLTDEEKKYYEYRCENCERRMVRRIWRWQKGHPDAELDAMFGGEH